MQIPYEIATGWRYMRTGRSARGRQLVSFIAGISIFGIALGVFALIVVLSVMNGFQKEVRDRMLGVVSHIEVFAPGGRAMPDVERTMREARTNAHVIGAAPFVGAQALAVRGDEVRGALVRGIDPAHEAQVTDLDVAQHKVLDLLGPGTFDVVLGDALADGLGVGAGDMVTLMVPGGQVTPAGVLPRLKQVRVAGLFHSGHYLYDEMMVYMFIDDAQRLFGLEGPSGVRLKLDDLHRAPQVTQELAGTLSDRLYLRDWTMQNPNWFAAVKMEKVALFIILTLIVAVAVCNLISTQVVTVANKRADIAILRTLGASPAGIMTVFVVQGGLIGLIGTMLGLLLGLLVAFNIDVIVPALETLLHTSFLPREVYFLDRVPSDPRWSDIMPITLIALALSLLATLYPSWRASRVNPAEALRYE